MEKSPVKLPTNDWTEEHRKLQALMLDDLSTKRDWKYVILKKRPQFDTPLPYEVSWSCVQHVTMALIGGYVMGCIFSLVMNMGDQAIAESSLSSRTQTIIYFRKSTSLMHKQGMSFGIFGSILFSYQCPLEQLRGRKDALNGFIGGAITGCYFAFSRRAPFRNYITGALGTGLLMTAFDLLLGF
ncbi:hypothetical protein SteCoe_28733 [Stentor coeruleus]|uniref:Mitochondrial import inner membrane translocase subunit TIM22 n=1 Tax=Stentor coeruleus TaxID=5963 RepID=A0A1R2B7L8_9CILI|nr:hypothetical protein SteCoe_28733 [Stentor coeruleus]